MFLAQQPYATVEPGPDLKAPQFCHVSVDCMELDSRPFAPCYTSGKPCEGQGVFMYVAPAEEIKSVVIGPRPAAPLTNYPAFTTTAPR